MFKPSRYIERFSFAFPKDEFLMEPPKKGLWPSRVEWLMGTESAAVCESRDAEHVLFFFPV